MLNVIMLSVVMVSIEAPPALVDHYNVYLSNGRLLGLSLTSKYKNKLIISVKPTMYTSMK
jgi:hypothetical protein